jgi:hypothetical protein
MRSRAGQLRHHQPDGFAHSYGRSGCQPTDAQPGVLQGGTHATVMEESEGATARKRVEGKVAIVTGAGQVDGPGIGTGKAASILLAGTGPAWCSSIANPTGPR